jgi:hypothetical protein
MTQEATGLGDRKVASRIVRPVWAVKLASISLALWFAVGLPTQQVAAASGPQEVAPRLLWSSAQHDAGWAITRAERSALETGACRK